MSIDHVELTISDDKNNRNLVLIYRGNENIIIREITYDPESDEEHHKDIKIPRPIFDNFKLLLDIM